MKNQKKKTLISIIATISVILVLVIGGILAYLTDTDRKVNNFIIGNVDIILHENNWNPTIDTDGDGEPDAVIMGMGDNIPKDPSVENVGKNSAYIYLKVFVPLGTKVDGLTTIENEPIFEYEIDSTNWTELADARAYDETTNSNIYVYHYNTALPAPVDENTPSVTGNLFDTISLKDGITADSLGAEPKSVIVEAYAIQSTGLPENTTVLNTEWAEEFKTYAAQNPQTSQTTSLISLEDATVSVDNETMEVWNEQNINIVKSVGLDGEIEPVTYSSSDTNVATVDSTGKITAVGGGTSTITVTGTKSGATKTIEITVSNAIPVSKYGQYVNLGTNLLDKTIALEDGSTPKADWRVFSSDSNGTWLILADYLPQSEITSLNTGLNMVSGETYNVNHSSNRAGLLTALRNETAWKGLLNGTTIASNSSVIVKGALTVQEWCDSWNANTGYTNIIVSGSESGGYKVNNKSSISLSGNSGYSNTLYFPHKSGLSGCNSYWLASPSADNANSVMYVNYGGYVDSNYYNLTNIGVRPAVYLPSNISLNTTGEVWTVGN